jgi:hypothetical protein
MDSRALISADYFFYTSVAADSFPVGTEADPTLRREQQNNLPPADRISKIPPL